MQPPISEREVLRWVPTVHPEGTAPTTVHTRRDKFAPPWYHQPQDKWPHPDTWPKLVVTCRTPGCGNEGWPIEMPYIGDPIFCGPCSARLD